MQARHTEQAALMHFCAPTPHGELHMQLPAHHGEDAVGAALALDDAQALLLALEQWLALSLDPAPAAGRAEPPPGLLWCSAADNAHLGLPWQLLAQAPPSGMPVLQGPELALHVVVARWSTLALLQQPQPHANSNVIASAAAAAAAGAGANANANATANSHAAGLLLLPASFAEAWRVTLVQPELGFEVDAQWPGPGHAPTLAGAPRAAEASAASVRLLQTLHWPLAAVMGWCQAPDIALSDQAQLWHHQAGGAQAVSSGCIVPALGGAGLLVAATAQPNTAWPAAATAVTPAATASATASA
jgi:hypothetical protein